MKRVAGGLAPLVVALLALTAASTRGQTDSPVHYFAERTFEIPYSMSADRPFRRLHLHVSSDGKEFTAAGSTLQREGAFTYTAKADGWYYFVVQVEENDGTLNPPRVQQAPPSMRVCVDSEKPRVNLRQVTPRQGLVAVEWLVNDRNIDLQTLRLEYRPVGATAWIPLKHLKMEHAQFDWNPQGPGPFEARVLVKDKAENLSEATTRVLLDPSRTGSASTVAGGGSVVGGAAAGADRKVIYVNKKTGKLNYNIEGAGPSKVKHVEVWMTRDTTQWTRYGEAPPTGPFEITVTSQGRYGFTLRPISGVGRGTVAPRAGDLPHVWVEVDETPPVVQLHHVIVGEGSDAGKITVQWRAEDKFLKEQPITIYYATSAEGEWKVLKENVENTGVCKCETAGLPFEFFVRVEATDKAGNKAHSQTRETVKVDLSEPKVTDINISIGQVNFDK
ncbi:MAG: hypothetical protein ACKO23_17375 [Gemmataceae bacterium]